MKERELRAAIEAAQKDYHEKSGDMTQVDATAMAAQITEMKKGLSDLICDGAKPCPNCKAPIIGMKRGRGLYEVGCGVCAPVEKDGRQIYFAANGETAEEAVYNWNADNFKNKPIIE